MISELAGANIGPAEEALYTKFIPSLTMSEGTFKVAIDDASTRINWIRERSASNTSSGLNYHEQKTNQDHANILDALFDEVLQ